MWRPARSGGDEYRGGEGERAYSRARIAKTRGVREFIVSSSEHGFLLSLCASDETMSSRVNGTTAQPYRCPRIFSGAPLGIRAPSPSKPLSLSPQQYQTSSTVAAHV